MSKINESKILTEYSKHSEENKMTGTTNYAPFIIILYWMEMILIQKLKDVN